MKYKIKKIYADTCSIDQRAMGSSCLSYLLIGKEKSLLIDNGFADPGLKREVAALAKGKVEVVNTHAHLDHIGNNHEFDICWMSPKDEETRALHTDAKYLEERISAFPLFFRLILRKEIKNILSVHPEKGYKPIKDGQTIDLGGRVIEAIETPGHSKGSICLLERSARALFTGDTICDIGILLHVDCADTPQAYLESAQRLIARAGEFDTIWPGHRTHPIDKGYLDEYEACARSIVEKTAKPKKRVEEGKTHLVTSCGRVRITHLA
jgi:glyoxylase-like metal-dependent hydrolase (beta-lactamase superfamily II)